MARGEYDSLPGARWVISRYVEPYMREGKSYDFYLLFDLGGGRYPTEDISQFGDDLLQEHIELGVMACAQIEKDFVGIDNQWQPVPFYDYFFDCE